MQTITEISSYKSYLRFAPNKNGGNLGLVLNDKKWKFLHKIICSGNLLESPRGGDSNKWPKHMILWRTNIMVITQDNLLESGLLKMFYGYGDVHIMGAYFVARI